ncbi:hypothetical protein AJ80_08175 [Polytolypa hystricis UAMH7299]|uniref:HOOK N-terminal domain-containing protein n=1 Tax=Polytolypa hystricis (strain UAMH7299) TaxID=1447883 RepID=A0A2B7XC47_POLH7|nr:hypothetical protein AJ80_08175 [Polytolypa hystricis UAMH7299]
MLPELVTSTLFEWLNSFPLGTTVRANDELTDGSVLWEVLQDVDPQFFLGELPERSPSDHWLPKWQNLKHIHKLLISYLRNQNEGQVPAGLNITPDLKAIAEDSSTKETSELLKLLLLTAISSPNAGSYVTTMQGLSTPTQEGLKDIIQEAQNPSQDRLDEVRDERNEYIRRDLKMDPELQFEERVGKVLAENDRLSHEKKELQKALEVLHDRLTRLQENNDALQGRLTSTEDRLSTLKSGKGELIPNAKVLENKTRQQEDIIASQEVKLAASQDEIDGLRMTVESLRVKTQKHQKLQDDYDEIKNERDQLSRKANAAEKYRQKLQASQDFEKEALTLRNQVNDLQQQLKDADSNQKSSSDRDREFKEYGELVAKIELDRHEIQNVKKQLEFNNHALTERLQSAEEQHDRDDAVISELRERLRELEGFDSPTTPGSTTPKAHGTFQGDLDSVGSRENQLKAENEELKKELEKLKAGDSDATVSESYCNQNMQLTYDDYNDSSRKLHDKYVAVRRRLADAEGEIESLKRELSDANIELGLVDKDKIDIVNEVKENYTSELDTHREDHDVLHKKARDLEARLDINQIVVSAMFEELSALRDMLKSKGIELEGEDKATLDEMKRLLQEIAVRTGTTPANDQLSATDLLKQLADTTERSAENLAKRAEHIHHQAELIKTLQDRLTNLEDLSVNPEEHEAIKEKESELMQIIQRQAREIALISSAWYDLQSRLQNSNASMSRYRQPASTSGNGGADAHRSWLAKQRAIVTRTSSRSNGW